jgi:putative addiction module component (TIGR02574 family)
MAHSIAEIEEQALQLSPEDRARLAVQLLASLEERSESAEAVEMLWVAEAERRFEELRSGVVHGIPAREVFAELRSERS